jgi:hypothetical protein
VRARRSAPRLQPTPWLTRPRARAARAGSLEPADDATAAAGAVWRPPGFEPLLAPGADGGAAAAARTWRHECYSGYKAQRSPTPAALAEALPRVRELLAALAVPCAQVPTVEADDVIATLAATAAAQGLRTAVVSPDKDFQQARARAASGQTLRGPCELTRRAPCPVCVTAAQPKRPPAAPHAAPRGRAAARPVGLPRLHRRRLPRSLPRHAAPAGTTRLALSHAHTALACLR